MKRSLSITRGVWGAFVLSAALAGASRLAPILKPVRAAEDSSEYAALVRERERLHGNEDEVRDRLRLQRATLNRNAWSPESLVRLQAQLALGWRWQWNSQERASITPLSPRLEDWADYVSLVTALGEKPGLIVEAFELKADGPARARRFTTVNLVLRFVVPDAASVASKPASPPFRPSPPGSSAGTTNKQNP